MFGFYCSCCWSHPLSLNLNISLCLPLSLNHWQKAYLNFCLDVWISLQLLLLLLSLFSQSSILSHWLAICKSQASSFLSSIVGILNRMHIFTIVQEDFTQTAMASPPPPPLFVCLCLICFGFETGFTFTMSRRSYSVCFHITRPRCLYGLLRSFISTRQSGSF
jgi:hypothetical protein